MNISNFGIKRLKFKVTVGSACWKMHILSLLKCYLENYWTEFHLTFSIDSFCDKDERFSV